MTGGKPSGNVIDNLQSTPEDLNIHTESLSQKNASSSTSDGDQSISNSAKPQAIVSPAHAQPDVNSSRENPNVVSFENPREDNIANNGSKPADSSMNIQESASVIILDSSNLETVQRSDLDESTVDASEKVGDVVGVGVSEFREFVADIAAGAKDSHPKEDKAGGHSYDAAQTIKFERSVVANEGLENIEKDAEISLSTAKRTEESDTSQNITGESSEFINKGNEHKDGEISIEKSQLANGKDLENIGTGEKKVSEISEQVQAMDTDNVMDGPVVQLEATGLDDGGEIEESDVTKLPSDKVRHNEQTAGVKRRDESNITNVADGDAKALQHPKRIKRWTTDSKPESNAEGKIDAHPSLTIPANSTLPQRPIVSRSNSFKNQKPSEGTLPTPRIVPQSPIPPTTSLRINNFVRPFTQKQLSELLAKSGTVEKFWMDTIRTHCYVTYSSVEEANACREALYNLQWPPQGGKRLVANFVLPEEVITKIEEKETPKETNQAPNISATYTAVPPPLASSPLPPIFPPPIKEPEPVLTLEQLFKKTKAKPQVFFLPLNDQQVADKLASLQSLQPVKPN